MTYTTNYNLKKPGTDDLVDVADLNDNADTIDAALVGKQDELTPGAGIDITDNVISANLAAIEIRDTGTTSNYTADELSAFASAGSLITFDGVPILDSRMAGGIFYFSTLNTNGADPTLAYRANNSVNASKQITLQSPRTLVISANSKTPASNSGDVTLRAADITAAAGWSPSADTDLATKKYVDDHGGGGSYSTVTVTLASADWSNNTQTVTVSGVTADNLVLVAPSPTDFTAYGSAEIRATAQATNSLTFTCTNTPTADLTVNIAIWG